MGRSPSSRSSTAAERRGESSAERSYKRANRPSAGAGCAGRVRHKSSAEAARRARTSKNRSARAKLSAPRETIFVFRDRGTGRPTKKERREIDALMDGMYYDDGED